MEIVVECWEVPFKPLPDLAGNPNLGYNIIVQPLGNSTKPILRAQVLPATLHSAVTMGS